jgi:RNA polymerase sigma-70 factor (ECF subfamily)
MLGFGPMANAAQVQLEAHRAVLTGHCYRMLGSVVDAEDAVQETMVRAWRGLESFDGRSSLRTWLHRIATNACLDALGDRARRVRSFEDGPAGTVDDPLESRPRTHWIEPIPDARVLPADGDPAEVAMLRERIRLAFVTALQHLPPRQRAALLLTEVVGFSAEEAADTLETSVASINSALQRARATLATRAIDEHVHTLPDAQAALVKKYVAAFERYDVEALTALLHDDATMSMPPHTLWLRGRDSIGAWFRQRGVHCQPSRLVPTMACGAPAFGQYRAAAEGGFRAFAINVLELSAGRIARTTHFLDAEVLFPAFRAAAAHRLIVRAALKCSAPIRRGALSCNGDTTSTATPAPCS